MIQFQELNQTLDREVRELRESAFLTIDQFSGFGDIPVTFEILNVKEIKISLKVAFQFVAQTLMTPADTVHLTQVILEGSRRENVLLKANALD